MRKRPKRPARHAWLNPRLNVLSGCAVFLILHLVLKEVLARYDIVSSVFAAGAHVPRWMIATAGTFAVIRLATFLLVPAALAWKAVMLFASRRTHASGTANESPTETCDTVMSTTHRETADAHGHR